MPKKSTPALIKPHMIVWARKKLGYDIIGAAKKIGVKPERLEAWESGELKPTMRQAKEMARVYQRPLSMFYLREVPKGISIKMSDFRTLPETEQTEVSPGLLYAQEFAHSRRSLLVELATDSDEGQFTLPKTVDPSDNAELVAERVREWLKVDWDTQRRWRQANDAFNGWREAVEATNTLVFHNDHLYLKFDIDEARGFSISETRYPVVMINYQDSSFGRVFTLLHEFTHLLLNEGGMCDMHELSNPHGHSQQVESFCNRVAGAVLVPRSLLLAERTVRVHDGGEIWSDSEIHEMSRGFSTSREVIVRRLLINKLTTQSFYENKRRQYQKEWKDKKQIERSARSGTGGVPPQHIMAIKKYGYNYTRAILSAYSDSRITLSDVSSYMGLRVKHLNNLERAAFSGVMNG